MSTTFTSFFAKIGGEGVGTLGSVKSGQASWMDREKAGEGGSGGGGESKGTEKQSAREKTDHK